MIRILIIILEEFFPPWSMRTCGQRSLTSIINGLFNILEIIRPQNAAGSWGELAIIISGEVPNIRDNINFDIDAELSFSRLDNFGGYKKGSRLGNFNFTIKFSLHSGIPLILVWIERINGSQGRNYLINEAKWANPGFWVFTGVRLMLLIGRPPRWRRPKAIG